MIGNRMLQMMPQMMGMMGGGMMGGGQMPGGVVGSGGNGYGAAMAAPWMNALQNFGQQFRQDMGPQGYGVQGGTGQWASKLRDRMQGAYQGQATNSAYPGG